jgi:Mn2+/Fe2+ NRAMP family transporter
MTKSKDPTAPSDTNANPSDDAPGEPPTRVREILRNIGPGTITAASIVGSGVLITTTKIGAETGFWLVWLILLGCIIKAFVQVELGRHTLAHGTTTLTALNNVPGPRLRVRWSVWFWLAMFVLGIGQLGAIVGVTGQCLALTFPLTGDFAESVKIERRQAQFDHGLEQLDAQQFIVGDDPAGPTAAELQSAYRAIGRRPVVPSRLAYTWDDVIWSVLATLLVLVLLRGKYRTIERLCFILVGLFTLLTLVNLLALQFDPDYAIHAANIGKGFCFRLPPLGDTLSAQPLAAAVALLGIVGIGVSELIFYPYWCLEKGYARQIGPCDESDTWAARARGWLRVMRWDVFVSLAVCMLVTVAFYLIGAAVLHRHSIAPAGIELVDTLATVYSSIEYFGAVGRALFLMAAVFVLFSTFFVVTAGNARVAADAIDVFYVRPRDEQAYRQRVQRFVWIFPLIGLILYSLYKEPIKLALLSGVMQALMLPLLAVAAVYFRYRRCDTRLAPGKRWDIGLWCSLLAILVGGTFFAIAKGQELVDQIVTTINW